MKITVKSELSDLTYYAKYKEALIDLVREERRLPLVGELVRSFGLKLNDIKIDNNVPSENWMHFSKFYGTTWLDVSLGLEELTARLRNPEDEKMVKDLYGKLVESIREVTFDLQRMTIQRHFSTKGDARSFLENLNPNYPTGFKQMLEGNGVFYTLKLEPNKMTIHITLVNSLYVPGGLFFSVENVFSPNQYDFERAFSVAKERYDFIVEQLNLVIVEE